MSFLRQNETMPMKSIHDNIINAPMAHEVAMILPGQPGEIRNRNVVVKRPLGCGLLRMNDLSPSYDPLQYPLLFLAGKDGWTQRLCLQNNVRGMRQRLTIAAFYA